MPNNFFDFNSLDIEDADDESFEFNEEEFKQNISSISGIKLADLIISNRYLGLYKELSILAMEELSNRRLSGDNFQFESYIEDNIKDLPKIDLSIPKISSIIEQIKGIKK